MSGWKRFFNRCWETPSFRSEYTGCSPEALRLKMGLAGLSLVGMVVAPRDLWPLLPAIALFFLFIPHTLTKGAILWSAMMVFAAAVTPSFPGKGFALLRDLLVVAVGGVLGLVGYQKEYQWSRWVVLSGLPSCILAVAQWTTAVPVPPSWLAGLEKGILPTRVMGLFGNPNLLAGYLLFLQPLAWEICRTEKHAKGKFWLAVVVLQTLVIALTFSYGAWFVLIMEAIAFLSLLRGCRRSIRESAILSLVAVSAVVVGWERIGGTAGYRVLIWRAVWRFIQNTPLGAGPGGFGRDYPLIPGMVTADHAHNLLFQTIFEYGWAGGIVLVIIGAMILKRLIQTHDPLHRALLLALMGQMAWGVIDYPWSIPMLAVLFWMGERWTCGVRQAP